MARKKDKTRRRQDREDTSGEDGNAGGAKPLRPWSFAPRRRLSSKILLC